MDTQHIKLGEHYICDLSGCNRKLLLDGELSRQLFTEAVRESGLTIIDEGYYPFSPHGFTCFLLLSESHASLHAWPEHGYCAIDIFTCNLELDIQALVKRLKELFKASKSELHLLDRSAAVTARKPARHKVPA